MTDTPSPPRTPTGQAETEAPAAVSAQGITVRYGAKVAVDDVDFHVSPGEVVGLIGPNGAGKTSLLECVEGLRRPAAGTVAVFGVDPLRDRTAMARQAGVQLQDSAYPARARVDEVCRLFASFYPEPAEVDELLAQFELSDKRKSQVTRLSGGQRQRLSLVLALIGRPKVVFLDELTTGLDPEARRMVWDGLRERNDAGLTVVLTSHHMDEVEYLCDRVSVMVSGKLVATDTVAGLIQAHASGTTRIVVENVGAAKDLRSTLEELAPEVTVVPAGNRLRVDVGSEAAQAKVEALLSERDLTNRRGEPSMDDVYLALTNETAPEGK
jgi:ABC-2 type transport system ATP-binding protein